MSAHIKPLVAAAVLATFPPVAARAVTRVDDVDATRPPPTRRPRPVASPAAPGAPTRYAVQFVLFGVSGLMLLGLVGAIRLRRRSASAATTHGSARWATREEAIEHTGKFPAGFALGRQDGEIVRHVGHMVTVAPTGKGKGTGCAIPNLLTYPGSAIVLDPKGELYAVTSRRRREMGHEVFLVDPFGCPACAGAAAHGANWLADLDPSSETVMRDAELLASAMVIPQEHDRHWDETAQELICGLLIYVASLPDAQRNMAFFRELLMGEKFVETLQAVAKSSVGFGIPARAARAQLDRPPNEGGSVLSSARRQTRFLDEPKLAKWLTREDFSLASLKDKRQTVYVSVPDDMLKTHSRFVRCFFAQAISGLQRKIGQPEYPVLLMLDEFAKLGYMEAIEDGISIARYVGAAFWIFLQDLSQLKVYRNPQTFIANSAKQFFGVEDVETAKQISSTLGKYTLQYKTTSKSTSAGKGGSSKSEQEHVQGRELLQPDEVMHIAHNEEILLLPGLRPVRCEKLNYLHDPEFAGLGDPNPIHASAAPRRRAGA
jgi:type IV secretory pathway TraG/TraD family ATPase VirD4